MKNKIAIIRVVSIAILFVLLYTSVNFKLDEKANIFFRKSELKDEKEINNELEDKRAMSNMEYKGDLSIHLNYFINKHSTNIVELLECIREEISYKAIISQGNTELDALYALNNKKGSCYQIAALAYELALELGYEAKYIVGNSSNGEGYEHAWIAIKYSEEWYYHDLLHTSERISEDELVNDLKYKITNSDF